MSEPSEDTPVTFGMLQQALDECGSAVGFALAGVLNTAGTERSLAVWRRVMAKIRDDAQ